MRTVVCIDARNRSTCSSEGSCYHIYGTVLVLFHASALQIHSIARSPVDFYSVLIVAIVEFKHVHGVSVAAIVEWKCFYACREAAFQNRRQKTAYSKRQRSFYAVLQDDAAIYVDVSPLVAW